MSQSTENYRTVSFTMRDGNCLAVFFNSTTNLLVVDVVKADQSGGNEIIRRTLDEKRLLKGL